MYKKSHGCFTFSDPLHPPPLPFLPASMEQLRKLWLVDCSDRKLWLVGSGQQVPSASALDGLSWYLQLILWVLYMTVSVSFTPTVTHGSSYTAIVAQQRSEFDPWTFPLPPSPQNPPPSLFSAVCRSVGDPTGTKPSPPLEKLRTPNHITPKQKQHKPLDVPTDTFFCY